MGVLETVLAYKQQREQQANADLQAIPQALQIFSQARQQVADNNMKLLNMKADLATKGIKLNSDGSFSKDESLQSPLDKLLEQGKAADAARSLGNRDLYNSIVGQQSQQANPITKPVESASQTVNQPIPVNNSKTEDLSPYLNEIDSFTQKPTARAEQAKSQLEINKKNSEPLSGDSASKFSGAQQGIQNINDIIEQINNYKGDKKDLIYQANKVIEASNANSNGLAGVLPGGKAIYRVAKLAGTSEEAKILANKLSTVAENLLRARTGAAATQDEINREYSRSLFMTKNEGAQGWMQKLKNNYDFLKTTHDEIRPGRKDEAVLKGEIQDNQSPQKESIGQMLGNNAIDAAKKTFTVDNLLTASSLLGVGYVGKAALELKNIGSTSLKAAQTIKQTAPIIEQQAVKAQASLTKLKGDELINATVKQAREGILKPKTGYIAQEHNLYSKAIDQIKGSSSTVKNADDLLRKFALNNRDETTLKFPTSEMQNVYESLSQKFNAGEKLTQSDLVNSMKSLKGKFGSGKVDASKRLNLNAASQLAEGLSGKSAEILKTANSRYSVFKTQEKNIDDLLGLYGKAKKTDSVVSSLLSKDLGIEQSQVAKFIGDKTGLDLLNTINYHRGINQVKDAFWFTRQLDNLTSGAKKVITSKFGKK